MSERDYALGLLKNLEAGNTTFDAMNKAEEERRKTCSTCKHWNRRLGSALLNTCMRINWTDVPEDVDAFAPAVIYCDCYSDFDADMMTAADFFCALHETEAIE